MAKSKNSFHPVAIEKPVVMLPVDEYLFLLKEAGYKPTPKLNREIDQARTRFRKGNSISWETLKDELQ